MPSKQFTFDFFGSSYGSSQTNLLHNSLGQRLAEVFSFKNDGQAVHKEINGYTYEVRRIAETDYGYRVEVGKHRQTDLPPAALIGGEEREIELGDDENILEKSHFLYYNDMELIVLRRNKMCIGHNNLATLLAGSGYSCSLNPVINPSDVSKLAQGNMMLRKAKFKIARPTNPELFKGLDHNFNNSIVKSMTQTNAAYLNAEFSGSGNSKNHDFRYLDSRIKRALHELTAKFDVRRCDIVLEDTNTGMVHPIDLVADRIIAKKDVELTGRQQVQSSRMFQAMEQAKQEKQDVLDDYFGHAEADRLT